MKYLIWSLEHNAWWRWNELGYTLDRSEAGEYTLEEAVRIVQHANHFLRPDQPPMEAIIPIGETEAK
jgi:hypothetical protein